MDLPPFRKFILPSLKTLVTCPQALPLLPLGFSPCPSTLLQCYLSVSFLQLLPHYIQVPFLCLHSLLTVPLSTLPVCPNSFLLSPGAIFASFQFLPCLPSPSLPESKAILNTELFFLFAQPLVDPICSLFAAGESQLTSRPLLTRQVSDMGQTGERQRETRHAGPGAQRGGILVGSRVGLERDSK